MVCLGALPGGALPVKNLLMEAITSASATFVSRLVLAEIRSGSPLQELAGSCEEED